MDRLTRSLVLVAYITFYTSGVLGLWAAWEIGLDSPLLPIFLFSAYVGMVACLTNMSSRIHNREVLEEACCHHYLNSVRLYKGEPLACHKTEGCDYSLCPLAKLEQLVYEYRVGSWSKSSIVGQVTRRVPFSNQMSFDEALLLTCGYTSKIKWGISTAAREVLLTLSSVNRTHNLPICSCLITAKKELVRYPPAVVEELCHHLYTADVSSTLCGGSRSKCVRRTLGMVSAAMNDTHVLGHFTLPCIEMDRKLDSMQGDEGTRVYLPSLNRIVYAPISGELGRSMMEAYLTLFE
jgi:hypothetical protein